MFYERTMHFTGKISAPTAKQDLFASASGKTRPFSDLPVRADFLEQRNQRSKDPLPAASGSDVSCCTEKV